MRENRNLALLVDIEKGEIWRSQAQKRLTPAERRVLTLLKNREGRPVPPQVITLDWTGTPPATAAAVPVTTS